jgi:hypothetical protein
MFEVYKQFRINKSWHISQLNRSIQTAEITYINLDPKLQVGKSSL